MSKASAATVRILLGLWLGAALAISFIAIPVVFAPATKAVVPPDSVGLVAQSILGRFFWIQIGLCGLSLLARVRAGGAWNRGERVAWFILGLGSLMAAFWLHPKLRELHRIKYDPLATVAARESAASDFRSWHGGSQVGNLVLLLTLGSLLVAGETRALRTAR